jgi:hypothetical protein
VRDPSGHEPWGRGAVRVRRGRFDSTVKRGVLATVSSDQLTDVQQRASAQYVLLANVQ